MGLDDAVSNSKIDEKILQLCLEAGILDYWSDEATSPNVDEALLEKWEKKLCYTGYSVAFHAVLPFVTIEVMGCSPLFVNSQGENISGRSMTDIRRQAKAIPEESARETALLSALKNCRKCLEDAEEAKVIATRRVTAAKEVYENAAQALSGYTPLNSRVAGIGNSSNKRAKIEKMPRVSVAQLAEDASYPTNTLYLPPRYTQGMRKLGRFWMLVQLVLPAVLLERLVEDTWVGLNKLPNSPAPIRFFMQTRRLLKIFRGPIKEKKIEQIHRMVDQRLISEEMGREQLRKFGVGNTTEGGAVSAAAVADVCANCGKKEGEGNNIKLKRCLACKEAQYCGSQCQKEHWKKHKKECRNKSKSTTGE